MGVLSTVAEETKSSSPYPGDILRWQPAAAGASVCGFSRTNTACTPCPITVSLVIVLGHTFIMISVLVMVVKHCSISLFF